MRRAGTAAARARGTRAHGGHARRSRGVRPCRHHGSHLGVSDRSGSHRPRAAHRARDRGDAARRGRRPRCGSSARRLGVARVAQGGLRLSPRRCGSGVGLRGRRGPRARPGTGTLVRRDPEPLRPRVPHDQQSRSGRGGRERAQRHGGIRRAAPPRRHLRARGECRVDAGDSGGHRSHGRHRGATGELRVLRPDHGVDRVLRASGRGRERAGDGGVASAGSVTLRRGCGGAGALEGPGARARGASGHGRGERRAGPDRGDAVAGARRDPGRLTVAHFDAYHVIRGRGDGGEGGGRVVDRWKIERGR